MLKKLVAGLMLGWMVFVAPTLIAAEAPSASEDPALEKRVMAIGEELRCLVCQNQTIADSHAELAVDLKNQVREMLKKGMSEREIKDYMVQRYGDFVLYRPEVKSNTWLLWGGPFVLLLGGFGFLIMKMRQRNRSLINLDQGMTVEAQKRAEAMLGMPESSSVAANNGSRAKQTNKKNKDEA